MQALFIATIGLGALLLFWVQPMFTKMALPLLGGAPTVWNTALVFFQGALLAGYAYAHLSTRYLGLKGQSLLHLAVLALALFVLPVGVASGWRPPVTGTPVFWLLGLLTVSLGLPFFAVAGTAPLVQKWFAHTGHPSSANPYFLYAASNVGSIVALVGYPLVLEPWLGLAEQSWAWSAGYALLAVLMAGCIWVLRRRFTAEGAGAAAEAEAGLIGDVGWMRRLHWVALAFAPSSLLLGVTLHVTTDLAAVPLLWVIPLTLYLLTFVIVFARRPLLKRRWMIELQAIAVVLLALALYPEYIGRQITWWQSMLLHLTAFFLTAMVCHGELARSRPVTRHLTEFYFWMALGGVLGGAFNALLAPTLFDSVLEYPLVIVLACLLRPGPAAGRRRSLAYDAILPVTLIFAVPYLAFRWDPFVDLTLFGADSFMLYGLAAGAVCYVFKSRPLRFALGLGMIFAFSAQLLDFDAWILARDRSFFGVYKVMLDRGSRHTFWHGTTIQGVQSMIPNERRRPMVYFRPDGPAGQLFHALWRQGRPGRVAVVGLGAGAMACYRRGRQDWTFYEIDPLVVRLARDPRYFTYLAECAGEASVVLGDARLSLEGAPDRRFDLLVVDAFTSDAIPVHLLTREALRVYLNRLADDGVLMFHITNRYLDVEPVLAGLAADAGLVGRLQFFRPPINRPFQGYVYPSRWVVLARKAEDLAGIAEDPRWRPLQLDPDHGLWTDDFSNIVGLIQWR